MADTLASLTPLVSADLRDSSNQTFSTTDVGEMINAALAEIGRLCPQQFREDIKPSTLTASTADYLLQASLFPSGNPLVEVRRVEVWDDSTTPDSFVGRLRPAAGEYANVSATGWEFWGGKLTLTGAQLASLDLTKHFLRVWGYAPYPQLAGSVSVDLPTERHYALREYCQVEGLRRLIASRELFTQWQTHDQNTNVTMAALMNMFATAQATWRSRARQIAELREAP